jgi:protocadherin Fat 1/2/3
LINVPSKILVSEVALSGTPVFTAIATDQDIGINSQVSFTGYSPEGKFVIDATSGVVKTVGNLDYESVKK